MNTMIFINLPVTDLERSKAFYEAVGAVNNPQFSDATAACMVVSDVIHVMLLTVMRWLTQALAFESRSWCSGGTRAGRPPASRDTFPPTGTAPDECRCPGG